MSKVINNGFRALCHGVCISLLCGFLLACVTVEDSVFENDSTRDQATEARVKVAIEHLRLRNTTEAIRNLNMALEENPKSARVHEVLAIAFQQNGDLELTEKEYKTALSLDKAYTRGRNNFASFLYDQKRYAEAMEEFEVVVKDVYYGNRATAYVSLGKCALKIDDMKKAEASFNRAVELDKNQSTGLIELSEIYYDRGEFQSAQNVFNKYRNMVRRKSPRSLLLGIRLAYESGDQDAIASYSMVLRNMYPNSGEFRELQRLQSAYE